MTKYIVYTSRAVPTLHEVEVVEVPGMTPIAGCDILIKNEHGHINSAKSSSYSDTEDEAIAAALVAQHDSLEVYEPKVEDIKKAIGSLESMQASRRGS